MKLELVVAAARNGVIGRDGAMPWTMPGDLKAFRRLTMGKPIVMGRRTFEAIGRPLDGRINIVVTRDVAFAAEGVEIAHTLEEALEIARQATGATDRIMVIGGGEIYNAVRPQADVIHLTRIDAAPEGDTYFPDPEPDCWREVERTPIPQGPRDEYAAELVRYERIER